MVRCEVVGQLPIVDAVTGEDKVKGQHVQLDPSKTNIRALVEAGLVVEAPEIVGEGGPELLKMPTGVVVKKAAK